MSEKCVISLGQLAVLVSNISDIEFILIQKFLDHVIEIRISSYSKHFKMSVKNGTNFTHVFFSLTEAIHCIFLKKILNKGAPLEIFDIYYITKFKVTFFSIQQSV